jgi:hypothetical protein
MSACQFLLAWCGAIRGATNVQSRLAGILSHATRCAVPARDEVTPDAPLRLNVAAALAFPDSSITASGLDRTADTRGALGVGRQRR